MWESHSDSNRIPTGNYDSEVGSQSSDSRTWERRKVGIVIDRQEPDAGYRENDGVMETLTKLWDHVCKKGLEREIDPRPGGRQVV